MATGLASCAVVSEADAGILRAQQTANTQSRVELTHSCKSLRAVFDALRTPGSS